MAKLRLTVACGAYDIVKPLIEGTVEADGLDLTFLTDMGPRERHWRMGRKHEFDVCEENVGAYYMIRDQGEPLTAIELLINKTIPEVKVEGFEPTRHKAQENKVYRQLYSTATSRVVSRSGEDSFFCRA